MLIFNNFFFFNFLVPRRKSLLPFNQYLSTYVWTNVYNCNVGFIGRRARCSSVVRAFAHGAMGRRIDPSWGGPIELFLVPASAP